MMGIDLRPFGFPHTVKVHGTVKASWSHGNRLLFLFGEKHSDNEMKRLYVQNAYRLYDLGIMGCVGTEIKVADLERVTPQAITDCSKSLFATYLTDDAVLDHLHHGHTEWWFDYFKFGSVLRLLRPHLPLRCVEDPTLAVEMSPIHVAYMCSEGCAEGKGPYPEYPKFADHPLNRKREKAMIENMLALWDEAGPTLAAILNTGSDHSEPIAEELRKRNIGYIYISIPATPLLDSGAQLES